MPPSTCSRCCAFGRLRPERWNPTQFGGTCDSSLGRSPKVQPNGAVRPPKQRALVSETHPE